MASRTRGTWFRDLSNGILASIVGGVVLLLVVGGAITVSIVNDNSNTVTTGGPRGSSPAAAGTTVSAAPEGSERIPGVSASRTGGDGAGQFDPGENKSTNVYENTSEYFFARTFFVAIGKITATDEAETSYRAASITLQEGNLPACTFTNVGSGRFFFHRSDREYEVTVDLPNSSIALVNVAEWTGRPAKTQPCTGEGLN